jgi:hypothetical protein
MSEIDKAFPETGGQAGHESLQSPSQQPLPEQAEPPSPAIIADPSVPDAPSSEGQWDAIMIDGHDTATPGQAEPRLQLESGPALGEPEESSNGYAICFPLVPVPSCSRDLA